MAFTLSFRRSVDLIENMLGDSRCGRVEQDIL